MKIYLIISIDTECDKDTEWKIRHPLQFRNISQGVVQSLQPLFDDYDIKPTYLLSPEVLKDRECVSLFFSLRDKVELGTHLHSEYIGPQAQKEPTRTESFQSDYSAEVEYAKLNNLTELFHENIGFAPKSFRAGRFGLSRFTLKFLEKLGYTVDSSVTPYMWWWRRRGEGVNFLGAPNQPYHPSRDDFRKPGDMKILEVPVTLVNHFWEKFPLTFIRGINPINSVQTVALNKIVGRHLKCQWLRPTYSTAQEMMAVTEHLIRQTDQNRVVLCMMFHSNEATAGMSPYNKTETDVVRFLDRIKIYFDELFSKFEIISIGLCKVVNS